MQEFKIEKMGIENVQGASEIEFKCFTDPWSTSLLKKELENELAHYYVITYNESKIVAYAGFWNIVDDGQIMNVAVDPDFRSKGLSNMLMEKMIEKSIELNMLTMSLEVRVSNEIAINLYKKFGFEIAGRRKNYYTDNNEDAYIMIKNL